MKFSVIYDVTKPPETSFLTSDDVAPERRRYFLGDEEVTREEYEAWREALYSRSSCISDGT